MSCISPFSSPGTVEVINARETVPRAFLHNLSSCYSTDLPIGKDTDWATRAVCPPGVQCTKLRAGEPRTLLTLSEVLFN